MLREGRFIKESPPQIGKFYTPDIRDRFYTREELFAQAVVLGNEDKQHKVLSKILGALLRV